MDEEITKWLQEQIANIFKQSLTVQDVKKQETDAFHLIYLASKSCIFTITDKLLREMPSSEKYKRERPNDVPVPIQDKWDFQMGDNVKIKSEFNDYESLKFISQQTVGWSKEAAKAISRVGIITSIRNEYDCHVQVLFPDCSFLLELYAGVLERTTDEPTTNTPSRFTKGDKVIIDASLEFVTLMQRNYESSLPKHILGKTGKVIAVTSEGVFVKFLHPRSLKINPALLKISEGNVEENPIVFNPKNLLPGAKVSITGNLKKFMSETKKNKLEWSIWMSKLPGKMVTVLQVSDSGTLRVCAKAGRSFDVHTSSVLSDNEVEEIEEDVPFKVDEWVKMKKTENLKEILESKCIPISVLEYLEYPARVEGYTSDSECGISYDSKYTIPVPTHVLEKASVEEAKLSQDILSKAQKLDVGSKVYLRLGPPNYVRNIFRDGGFSEEISDVFTNVATIRGFIGFNNAVIECADGKLRKISRSLLTLPEKYLTKEKADLNHDLLYARNIVNRVERSIVKIQERFVGEKKLCLNPPLQFVTLRSGQPSTLHLDIKTLIFGFRDLKQELERDTTWKFTGQNDDEHIRIEEIDSEPVDIFVRFVFDTKVVKPSYLQASETIKSEPKTENLALKEKSIAQKEEAYQEAQQPESDQQAGDLSMEPESISVQGTYRHMVWRVANKRILVPYKYMQASDHEGVNQERTEEMASGGNIYNNNLQQQLQQCLSTVVNIHNASSVIFNNIYTD